MRGNPGHLGDVHKTITHAVKTLSGVHTPERSHTACATSPAGGTHTRLEHNTASDAAKRLGAIIPANQKQTSVRSHRARTPVRFFRTAGIVSKTEPVLTMTVTWMQLNRHSKSL